MPLSPLPIFVVSAPSGTGKTTLNRRLVAEHPEVQISVSYTTRGRRPSEVEGVHYHYVSEERFRELMNQGEMLEYAEVFGTLYGTSKTEIERLFAAQKIPLLEIDVQGWRSAMPRLKDVRSVFILPPSVEELWKRLEGRGTEPLAVRWKRLRTARDEIKSGGLYQKFIINRDLESAYEELEAVLIRGDAPKLTREEGLAHCAKLLDEFDSASWIRELRQTLG
jgi:guanylate kinase